MQLKINCNIFCFVHSLLPINFINNIFSFFLSKNQKQISIQIFHFLSFPKFYFQFPPTFLLFSRNTHFQIWACSARNYSFHLNNIWPQKDNFEFNFTISMTSIFCYLFFILWSHSFKPISLFRDHSHLIIYIFFLKLKIPYNLFQFPTL